MPTRTESQSHGLVIWRADPRQTSARPYKTIDANQKAKRAIEGKGVRRSNKNFVGTISSDGFSLLRGAPSNSSYL